jgi:SNF2 family DNA or RNA helicase
MYLPVHCSPTEHEILKSLETRTARAIENALATTVVVTAGVKRIKTEQMTANELASMEFFTHLMRLRERTELNAHYSEAVHSFREKHPNDPIPNELVAAVPLSNKEISLITLLKHVCKHPRRKALLYIDFIATSTRIAHVLNTYIPEMVLFMLRSSMKPGARQAVIDGFNSWKGNAIFVSNIKCGERGINLQAADMTIFLSSQYNPSAEAQAMYRNARLSTEHELVTVVYLSMDNTIQGWMSNIGADKLVRSMEIGCDDDPDDSVNRKRGLDGKLKTKQVVEAHKARQFVIDVVAFAEKRTPRSQPDPLVGLCNCGEDPYAEMAAIIQQVSCAGNNAGCAN